MPHYDPFDGNCFEVPVSDHIHVDQLRSEIARRVKRDDIQLVHSHEADSIEESDGKGVLYVSPKDIDERTVRQAVLEHKPRQHPGASSAHPEAPVDAVSTPVTATRVSLDQEGQAGELIAALESGKDLKVAEVNEVLRALLGHPAKG